MVKTWIILGTVTIVLGIIVSFFLGDIEFVATGIASSLLSGLVFYTVSWALNRLERITDAVEHMASGEQKPETAKEQPHTQSSIFKSNPAAGSHSSASKSGPWTCTKCFTPNSAEARYCKECGAYK
jgi:hypothetical protein